MHQDLSEKEKTKCQYACGWHRNLSEEQKNKKQKYGWEQYKNLPEDERQSLVECRKNYAKMRKKKTASIKTVRYFWLCKPFSG